MSILLRPARPEDKAAIEGLFLELLRSVYGREEVQGYEPGYLDKFFAGGDDAIVVAEEAGQVIAYLSMEEHREWEQEPFLYLDDFCVAAPWRSQGIGGRLLDLAQDYARQLGLGQILLHVEKSNLAAQRLYRRRGFDLLEEQERRLLLRKSL